MKDAYIPLETEDHTPTIVKRILKRIHNEKFDKIALYGFSPNMKWLVRLLKEEGRNPILVDWRDNIIGYDCSGETIKKIDDLGNSKDILVVACIEEINLLKASFRYIIDKKLHQLPVIYDRTQRHNSYDQEEPYRTIRQKAESRARSMLGEDQLFDLMQIIRATADVEGDIVEFGSLYGGSGAILTEAVNYYNKGEKKVMLFDSFSGIPKSRYGLDHRWNGAFSDNSYCEVKAAFADCPNVEVIQGNICDTYTKADGKISFGYVASDTMETGEILLKHMWDRLSPGGIIAVCDYGSYPNCVPLTVMTDMFLEDKQDQVVVFQPLRVGIYIMKKRNK